MINIAIAKGYLWDQAYDYLLRLGLSFPYNIADTRKLSVVDSTQCVTLFCVRSWDVPTYVEQGAADLGIVGKDVLYEQQPNIMELLDLKFGGCQLVLAGPNPQETLSHGMRVATKYTHSTLTYFRKLGLTVKPIALYGAIELAPNTGLADIICDLTATGSTLRDNGHHILDTVFDSTARLIANVASMHNEYSEIMDIAARLSRIVDA